MTNIPAPYRVDFFNELGRFCELTVLFELAASTMRHAAWQTGGFVNFKGIVLDGCPVAPEAGLCFSVRKWLKRGAYDVVVVANAVSPTGILAIEIMKARGIPFIIEGDGGFAKSGRGVREWLKRHLYSAARYWFSTGNTHTDYYLAYGAKPDGIFVYPFTSIWEADILSALMSSAEKQALKMRLGIREQQAVIAVGRFVPQKGFDVLLRAACRLDKTVGLYIVGGEAPKEYTDYQQTNGLDNVHVIGFRHKRELWEYYKACDVFVLPTREDIWGLVVNEAMACGLPIITTKRCIAGLELIKDDENGFLVPVGDVPRLAAAIDRLLANPALISRMAANNLLKIRSYTIEKMASRRMDVFMRISDRLRAAD